MVSIFLWNHLVKPGLRGRVEVLFVSIFLWNHPNLMHHEIKFRYENSVSIFLWNHHILHELGTTEFDQGILVSIFLWNHPKQSARGVAYLYRPFQYSFEITLPLQRQLAPLAVDAWVSIFLWNHRIIFAVRDLCNSVDVSIFLWNHPLCWFLFWVLKLFLPVPRASWEHVSTSNAYGSCLFPRFALEIELLFPRNFNSHGNGLFPQ